MYVRRKTGPVPLVNPNRKDPLLTSTLPRRLYAAWLLALPVALLGPSGAASAAEARPAAAALRWGALTAPGDPFAATPVFASARRTVTYGGSTKQGDPLVLRLSSNRRRLLLFVLDWEAKCTSGETFGGSDKLVGGRDAPRLSRTGRFSGRARVNSQLGTGQIAATSATLVGRVTRTRGSGTFRARVVVRDPSTGATLDRCDTGRVRWSTAAHQNRVYAGVTSQNEPVVLQTDAHRRHVTLVRIGWDAACDGGGFAHVGDSLAGFAISRRGGFSGSFTATFGRSTSVHGRLQYQIRGRVGAGRASGSFHVLDTVMDSSGATIRTCDSGTVRWSAVQ